MALVLCLAGGGAARALPNGPLWETDGEVSAIVEHGGVICVGGGFGYVGPHTGSGVALSPASGSVDTFGQ